MHKELDWNGPRSEPQSNWEESDLENSILDRFVKIVEQYPNKIAINDVSNSINYKELSILSWKVSEKIKSKRCNVIGIFLPASSFYIASMIATLSIGIPYVPLDINMQKELINNIISESKIDLIITDNSNLNIFENFISQIIVIDEIISNNDSVNCLIEKKSVSNSIACVIYTSGTTGNTKGVFQSHRILLKDIMDYTQSIHINENDVLSWFYSPNVGGAIRDVFGTILNGASLVVMHSKTMSITEMLERTYNYKVTIFHAIPSLLRIFLNHKGASKRFESVRLVYIAGDKFFTEEIAKVFDVFPNNCYIYNGIGATECTTLYCQWFIRPNTIISSKVLPVGYPTMGKEVRIMDENGVDCKIGEIGEAVVSSEFIALGYWQNIELSKNKFLPHPDKANVRIYQTGDLFKQLKDGNLEIVGRKDKSTKVRGYMININLIEASIIEMEGIKGVAVFTEIINNENNLIAIFEPETNFKLTDIEIRNYIKDKIPDNHIPNFIYKISEIPLLHNLKHDIQYLRKYAIEKISLKNDNTIDKTEDIVTKIWTNHLPKSKENKDLSFEYLGGDSLKALQILSELENYFPNLNNGVIHAKQTLSNLKHELLSDKLINLPELFIFPPRAGTYQSITNFTKQVSEKYFVRIVKYPDINEVDSIAMPINQLAKLSSKYINIHAKSKTLIFLGLSFGSRISHDTACILKAEGFEIKHIVWDTGPYFKKQFPHINMDGLWSRILQYQNDGILFKIIINQIKSWLEQYLEKYFYKYFAIYQRRFKPIDFEMSQAKLLQNASFTVIKYWTPMKFEGIIHLLYSSYRQGELTPQNTENFGWNDYANDVKIYKINAEHVEIFEDNFIEEFIKTIYAVS